MSSERHHAAGQPGVLPTAGLWLRGGAALAGDVYRATVDIAEGVHRSVSEQTAPVNPAAGVERLIRSLVYHEVREIGAASFLLTRAGLGLSRHVAPWPNDARVPELSLMCQSALNGICGDYLVRHHNELALAQRFVDHQGVILSSTDLQTCLAGARRLVVLIHGLGMNDRHWRCARTGQDMGQRLADDLEATVIRLRYNTGLPIADNGAALAAALEDMWSATANRELRLSLVGHSMGGLVARAALAHGQSRGQSWTARLTDIVCLGSPHRGAPLERLGQMLGQGLTRSAFSRPFAAIAEARSAGVKNLHDGLAWPDRTLDPPDYLLIAATLGRSDRDRLADSLGDLLVPVNSATDARQTRHEPSRSGSSSGAEPDDPRVSVRVFHRRHHFDLLHDEAVYRTLSAWLAEPRTPRAVPVPASGAPASSNVLPIS